jgi:hypothetical protein
MLRRNPDAIALAVIGLFALALSVPSMLFRETHWAVTPLKTEILQTQNAQIRAVRAQIEAGRRTIKAREQSIRRSIHY